VAAAATIFDFYTIANQINLGTTDGLRLLIAERRKFWCVNQRHSANFFAKQKACKNFMRSDYENFAFAAGKIGAVPVVSDGDAHGSQSTRQKSTTSRS